MIRRNFVSSISAFRQQTFLIKRKHEFLIIKSGRGEQAWIAVLAYLMKMQPTRLPPQGQRESEVLTRLSSG